MFACTAIQPASGAALFFLRQFPGRLCGQEKSKIDPAATSPFKLVSS